MTNPAMNFGLVFETVLGAFLCYVTPIGSLLGTRPLRFTHWLPGKPNRYLAPIVQFFLILP